MTIFEKNILYYGREADLPEVIPLKAGPLSLNYENGDLRYIRLGNQEIVRRIYVAVRDHNWATIQPALSNIHLDIQPDLFHIAYDVQHKERDIDFFWHGTISGDSNGSINFSMDGEAHSTFMRNRIGFCILHPPDVAGAAAHIEHVDGTKDEGVFPVYIAPQYLREGRISPVVPFAEMRSLRHQIMPDLWMEIQFDGDIFEMEDQRNWTDASYKTYCTPLRLPIPANVDKGTRIVQSVALKLVGDAPPQTEKTSNRLTFYISHDLAGHLPRLGLGSASHGKPLTAKEVERLSTLNLFHLRADIYLGKAGGDATLRQATAEARAVGASLELALHLTDNAQAELNEFRSLINEVQSQVSTWLIFHQNEKSTREHWVHLARNVLSGYDSQAKIGSGTNVYFTELNRERPKTDLLDVMVYSVNPTVHAIDHVSVVETLQAHAATVETARQFSDQAQIAVTPVTFKMRFNPSASRPEPETPPGELPQQVDPRQMSLFGAGWTLGSIKYLAESGVYSATYYETTGWRGVMETEDGSPVPDKFHSIPGGVFPMYHLIADVGEFEDGEVIISKSTHPLILDGLALRKAGRVRVLLANFTTKMHSVHLPDLRGTVSVKSLDETNAEFAMREPESFRLQPGQSMETGVAGLDLDVMPFAVVRIDAKSQ